MPVIVISEASLTPESYDGMAAVLADKMRRAPGFIAHVAGDLGEGWRVIEFWESAEAANRFFADEIHPLIPPGVKPRRRVTPVHNLVRGA